MIPRVAIAGIATAAALAGGVAAAIIEAGSQYDGLASQVSQLQQANQRLQQQVAADEAKLNAASVTGDLITCTDLRNMESNVSVSVTGTDSYGNAVSGSGWIGSPWLPPHCYKS